MELGPSWEANSCSATQEISGILQDLKVHKRVQQGLSLLHTLSQINPLNTLTSYFLHTYLVFHPELCALLLVPKCATCPAHLTVLDFFHFNIWQGISEDLPCQCDEGLSLCHMWGLCRCVVSEIGTHLSCRWWSHCTAPSPSRTRHGAMRWSHWSSSC
jgi:hypothetical protein